MSYLWVYSPYNSEKAMAPYSSTLAWKIPWAEEPGRLQSMGSLTVGYDWATSLSLFIFMHWRRNGNPFQCSCLENPRDRGACWAAVYGVAQSRTWLKWLSSSSSSSSTYWTDDFFLPWICLSTLVENQPTIWLPWWSSGYCRGPGFNSWSGD